MRVVCAIVGSDSQPFLTPMGGMLNDGASFPLGTGAGLRLGTSPTQKLGFWDATPVARPGPFVQNYTPSTRTVAPYVPTAAGASYGGIASGMPGSTYAQSTDLNHLRLAYENLRAHAENTTQVLNGLINDLKSMGLLG